MVSTKERFVAIPNVLTDEYNMIILTDIQFWSEHENELRQWCQDNDSEFVGMTVTFSNLRALTAFILKWQ
jgi:hypothetical protein